MDAIAAQLSALPPSVNPYLALASVLRTQLTPPAPDAFETGLFVSQGALHRSAVSLTSRLLRRGYGARPARASGRSDDPADRPGHRLSRRQRLVLDLPLSPDARRHAFRRACGSLLRLADRQFNAPLAWLVCFAAYGPIVVRRSM